MQFGPASITRVYTMRLDNFDLNLLVAFQALIEECSVTRAAERLNVTQPAMSASLKRLREAFQDDLLVLHGKTMIPTPHARDLAPAIAEAISNLRGILSAGTGFDPASSTRRFCIAASDYITTVLIVPLLKRLEEEAPSIRLDVRLPSEESVERLSKGEFDLLLTPRQFVRAEHPADLLFRERHVVVGSRDNPLFSEGLTAEAFAQAGHVAVRIDGRNAFIENALADAGIERRVEIYAPSFIQLPHLLPGTNRLALMHERLARLMVEPLHLAWAPVPFEIPLMEEMMQYHSTRRADAGLTWLRRHLSELAEQQAIEGS
ncbi:LysR family transcriptional regulator [Altererythrobacter sp. B11]|uniref:LysR family transcriptional regulator n=1 Tax=Altererythrobacter sp. B11 TaxID=2060312 RepID=UPI000DC6DAAE|nr:LysR family transcriptional regulator [Altererythrobacter sp. B11]BBC74244.1 LysR family transcriptional regulator [Altererythrobacter sp. B11]